MQKRLRPLRKHQNVWRSPRCSSFPVKYFSNHPRIYNLRNIRLKLHSLLFEKLFTVQSNTKVFHLGLVFDKSSCSSLVVGGIGGRDDGLAAAGRSSDVQVGEWTSAARARTHSNHVWYQPMAGHQEDRGEVSVRPEIEGF